MLHQTSGSSLARHVEKDHVHNHACNCTTVYLTNRFHVAVRLFSNRSQIVDAAPKLCNDFFFKYYLNSFFVSFKAISIILIGE